MGPPFRVGTVTQQGFQALQEVRLSGSYTLLPKTITFSTFSRELSNRGAEDSTGIPDACSEQLPALIAKDPSCDPSRRSPEEKARGKGREGGQSRKGEWEDREGNINKRYREYPKLITQP